MQRSALSSLKSALMAGYRLGLPFKLTRFISEILRRLFSGWRGA